MEMPFLRTPYNYDREAASDDSGLMCTDPSLAQQQFREDSDINTIVKRFNLTGEIPQGVNVPRYGDFASVYDYHSAMNLVRSADSAFMQMPADVRARFGNDAGAFVDFVSDPANAAEAEKLGLTVGKGDLGALDAPQALPKVEETSPTGASVDSVQK